MTDEPGIDLDATHGLSQADWDAFRAFPDEATFRPIYEASRALVWTISMRVLRDPEDAADAMQSTFCRLLQLADEPEEELLEAGIQQAVYRIAVREANNLRMRRQRRTGREVVMAQMPGMAANEATAGQALVASETRAQVEQIVEALPDHYRLPVLLHYFDGLSHREVALAMGTPTSTVSNRIARAHKMLEGLFRKAGLGAAALLLTGIEARASLLEPPARLTAEAVFASASAEMAGGVAGLGPIGAGARRGLVGSGTAMLGLMMLLVITIATVVTVRQIQKYSPYRHRLQTEHLSVASPATAGDGNTRDVMARGGMGLFDSAVVDEARAGVSCSAPE